MGRAFITVIRTYDEVLYNKGHLVDRWAESVAASVTRGVMSAAPVNKRKNKSKSRKTSRPSGPPGFLKANIDTDKTRAGTRQFVLNTTSRAGYTMHVIRGTLGGNRREGDKPYRLPLNSGYGGRTKILKFKGQAPNNFMIRGLDRAAISHPCLRG